MYLCAKGQAINIKNSRRDWRTHNRKIKEEDWQWNYAIFPRKVIFDFSNVAFMDSAGIGMLLGRYKVIKMLGGQLELMNVNKQVEKVFEISGILKIIPLIKNNEENVG